MSSSVAFGFLCLLAFVVLLEVLAGVCVVGYLVYKVYIKRKAQGGDV